MIYETVQFLNQSQLKTRPLVVSYEGSDFAGADEIIYSATTVAEFANIPAGVTRLNIELTGPTSITGAFSGLKFLKSVIITSATLTAMTDCFTGCGMIEDMQLNLPNLQTISFVPQPTLPTQTGLTNLDRNDRPYFRKLVLFSNRISAMTNLNAGTFYLISNLTVMPVDEYVGVVSYVDVRITRLKCFVKHVNCASRVADELEILDLDRFITSTDGFYDRYNANAHIVGVTLRRGLSAFMADVLVYYGDLSAIDVDIVSCVVVDHVVYNCNSEGFYTQSTSARYIFEFNAPFVVGGVNYYPYGPHSSFVAGDHYYTIGGTLSNYSNVGANIHYVNYRNGAITSSANSLTGVGSNYNNAWLLVPRFTGLAGAATFNFGGLCIIRGAILDSFRAVGNSFQNSVIAAPLELSVVQVMSGEAFINSFIADVVTIGNLSDMINDSFLSNIVTTAPIYLEALITVSGHNFLQAQVLLGDVHLQALTSVSGDGMLMMTIINCTIHAPHFLKPGGFFMLTAAVSQNQTFPVMYTYVNNTAAFSEIDIAAGVTVTLPLLPTPPGFQVGPSNQGTIIFADQTFP